MRSRKPLKSWKETRGQCAHGMLRYVIFCGHLNILISPLQHCTNEMNAGEIGPQTEGEQGPSVRTWIRHESYT